MVEASEAKGDDAVLALAEWSLPWPDSTWATRRRRWPSGKAPPANGRSAAPRGVPNRGGRRGGGRHARRRRGQTLLDAAAKDLAGRTARWASRLQRIRGDCHALAGAAPAARKAYDEAERLLGSGSRPPGANGPSRRPEPLKPSSFSAPSSGPRAPRNPTVAGRVSRGQDGGYLSLL